MSDILRAGAMIDTCLDERWLMDVVAEVVREEPGEPTQFSPKPAEEMALLWNKERLAAEFTTLVELARRPEWRRIAWLAVARRASQELGEIKSGEAVDLSFYEPFWEATGYLSEGETLAEKLTAYYHEVVAIAQRGAFP